MLVLTVMQLDTLKISHWATQIERQEEILCGYAQLVEEETRKWYASLDSVDQVRELPVFVGATTSRQQSSFFDSDGSSSNFFASNLLPRAKTSHLVRQADESSNEF